MVEEAKEIENSESLAVRLMRLSYIERIGTLLGIMIGEDISPRKSIVNEFHVAYDTIRKFLKFDTTIQFETIAKFCYIIGYYLHEECEAVENYRSKKHIKDRDERLGRINQLQREYKEIYGAGAEAVEDLIKKESRSPPVCEQGGVIILNNNLFNCKLLKTKENERNNMNH